MTDDDVAGILATSVAQFYTERQVSGRAVILGSVDDPVLWLVYDGLKYWMVDDDINELSKFGWLKEVKSSQTVSFVFVSYETHRNKVLAHKRKLRASADARLVC
jgi:hypothetical protein